MALMKINVLGFSVLFASAMLQIRPCVGQSNVVFYGADTNAIAVTFVDSNLTASLQASIVTDLRMCLQNWGQSSKLYLRDKGESAGYLYNSKDCLHYPDNIEFPENVISNGSSGLALQIPKSLSDAYTNAFAFVTANSNIVAAAYEFVAFISSSNFVYLSSNALPNYVLFKNRYSASIAQSNEIVRLASQIIQGLCHQTYYTPSVLGFYYSSEGPAATNLWLNVPCSTHPYGDTTEWSGYPVLWHNGKWKFCSWNEWVP